MSEEDDKTLSLEEIKYGTKSLADYEEELTRKLPAWPCNSSDLIQAIIDLNNKYQTAFNCYNDLIAQHAQSNRELHKKINIKVSEKIEDIKEKAPGARVPAKDTIVIMVSSEDEEILAIKDRTIMIELVKTFFENNKQKLEKTMMLAKDLLYSISATERATSRVDTHTNGH